MLAYYFNSIDNNISIYLPNYQYYKTYNDN